MNKRTTKFVRENFFSDVYGVVRLIPKGRVTTYGAIANYLGLKSGSRMVGWAMNASHAEKDVPAHRVVNSTGLLTGRHHFETPTTMEKRLVKEGVIVKNHQIQDFKSKFWSPEELSLR
jgi:methylated-DNA-protein-cysteine methyltransferase-like protein